MHAPLAAQSSPGGFRLPTPTPSPTSTAAPQGPVDIREGVQIGPRTIRNPTPSPSPTPTPNPPPPPATAPTSPPISSPTPANAERATSRAPNRSDDGGAPQAADRRPPATPAPSRDLARDPVTASPPVDEDPSIAQDGFSDHSLPPGLGETTDPVVSSAAAIRDPGSESWLTSTRLQALVALLVVILSGLGWVLWRRTRTRAQAAAVAPASALASGVHQAIAATDGPGMEPAPKKFDLRVDIVTAQRSFMALMVEYRVTVTNRSDRALRDIAVGGCLADAQRAADARTGEDAALELIERIGPHQSRSVSGEARLALSDITPIRQGNVPVLVPMLHLSLTFADGEEQLRSFVVGMPSAVKGARLHPIPLDTPPGGIHGLTTRELRQAGA